MTIIEIIDAFTFYGIDVIVLAAITSIIVQILKLTVFKNFAKKIITFLPFIIGFILYATYSAVCNLSIVYIAENFTKVLEYGFAVGAMSTVLYVWYEQFIREKSDTSSTNAGVVATLIEAYVPSDCKTAVAESIAEAVKNSQSGCAYDEVKGLLQQSCNEGISEQEVTLLATLIVDTLAKIK